MKEKETAAEETVIKLEHICKSYYIGTQEVPVLTDIQLTINKGSFISIMGPSGAGKSTLMNILGCLDRPTKGSYQLDGEEVATLDYTKSKDRICISKFQSITSVICVG